MTTPGPAKDKIILPLDAPCFDRLEVIHDPVARPGPLNMALDEVLLSSAGETAILRLYSWAEPTVSFGYFESAHSAHSLARGQKIVRRWTGGGIVEHGEDLTYSLCVPRQHAFASVRGIESYRRIHVSVARALRRCGLPSMQHEDIAPAPADPRSENACFERPVLHDLLADGRKVAGAAQRRCRAGLLHQGSVRPASDGTGQEWRACMWRELPFALSVACQERPFTSEEIALATTLASTKYVTAEWTNRA